MKSTIKNASENNRMQSLQEKYAKELDAFDNRVSGPLPTSFPKDAGFEYRWVFDREFRMSQLQTEGYTPALNPDGSAISVNCRDGKHLLVKIPTELYELRNFKKLKRDIERVSSNLKKTQDALFNDLSRMAALKDTADF